MPCFTRRLRPHRPLLALCCCGSMAALGAARPLACSPQPDARHEPPQHQQGDQPTRTVYVNHVNFVARQDVETREHVYITPTPETVVNLADWLDLDSKAERIRYTIAPAIAAVELASPNRIRFTIASLRAADDADHDVAARRTPRTRAARAGRPR